MSKLTWTRTVIGGKTADYDFAARDGAIGVGRIYRDSGTSHSGPYWYWTMNAFGPGIDRSKAACSGSAASKPEAAELVARAWQGCRNSEWPGMQPDDPADPEDRRDDERHE